MEKVVRRNIKNVSFFIENFWMKILKYTDAFILIYF